MQIKVHAMVTSTCRNLTWSFFNRVIKDWFSTEPININILQMEPNLLLPFLWMSKKN